MYVCIYVSMYVVFETPRQESSWASRDVAGLRTSPAAPPSGHAAPETKGSKCVDTERFSKSMIHIKSHATNNHKKKSFFKNHMTRPTVIVMIITVTAIMTVTMIITMVVVTTTVTTTHNNRHNNDSHNKDRSNRYSRKYTIGNDNSNNGNEGTNDIHALLQTQWHSGQ